MPLIAIQPAPARDGGPVRRSSPRQVQATEQATASDGNLGAERPGRREQRLLDAHRVGRDRAAVPRVRRRRAALTIEAASTVCDEATFVDWEEESAGCRSWQTAFEHLVADGTGRAPTAEPSPANATRALPRAGRRTSVARASDEWSGCSPGPERGPPATA